MTPSAESPLYSTTDPHDTGRSSSAGKDCTNGFHAPHSIPTLGTPVKILETELLLHKLFSESAEAKIWGVASKALNYAGPPRLYPEYTKPGGTDYVYRELDFWTSGFFPGSLHLLWERRKICPDQHAMKGPKPHDIQIEHACKWWTENLHQNAFLKGTHDLGFMVMPWASLAWKLNGDKRALKTMKETAKTLVARFSPEVGCIRSWDKCQTKKYDFQDPNADFLVIIDNLMNLSLLFSVSEQTNDTDMWEAAVRHARTTAKNHVRNDASTTHLVVFCPGTGQVKDRLTNQGFSHTSCWARGQAWAIAGFAETYYWTHADEFLATARQCADYFLERLPPSDIAPWDFDALKQSPADKVQPPDTSATMIAAYGMLLIHQAMMAKGESSRYLSAAFRLAKAVCSLHLNSEAKYVANNENVETVEHGNIQTASGIEVDLGYGETIVNGATINNYEFAPRRWADHGLVYADYYFLLFGNELLKMNLGSLLGQLAA